MIKKGILDPEGKNNNPYTNEKYSDTYKELAKKWSNYPAYRKAETIIKDIADNQVILVISGTGSGKTVLIPKYTAHVFDYQKKIAITLPKQIIAKSAAEFASKTLDVKLGEEVGYQYKGESKTSSKTKLLYATDGTIVARLQKDPQLQDFSAVIIDEAHERKVQIDFLLYLLRNTLEQRPEFKLIIMSATINETLFENYYYKYKYKTVHVGSETNYPIESIYLPKSISNNEYLDKGLEIIKKLDDEKKEGDILFFVTSVNETISACNIIKYTEKKYKDNFCVEVYANVPYNQQLLAQDKEKYKEISGKKRKIVIATNVAESSLTIDGIKYVIDSGYELLNYYDPTTRARVLEKKFVSQAQAIQRKGRAGRMESGTCYHLYTENEFNEMKKFPEPTIRTSNIYDDCLKFLYMPNIRTIGNLVGILSEFIEPPKEIYIRSAITQLVQLGLISNNEISKIGEKVVELNTDPMQGLSLIMANKLKCIKELIAIFAMIEVTKGVINEVFEKYDEKKGHNYGDYQKIKKYFNHKYGDHLSLLKIYIAYNEQLKKNNGTDHILKWCKKNYLKHNVLDKANKTYTSMLINIKRELFYNKLYDDKTSDKQDNKQSNNNLDSYLQIPDIYDYKNEYKLLFSIAYGFRLNIANMTSSKYRLSRDSFLHFGDVKNIDNIVYNELFTSSGKTEYTVVSVIPKKIKNYVFGMFK